VKEIMLQFILTKKGPKRQPVRNALLFW